MVINGGKNQMTQQEQSVSVEERDYMKINIANMRIDTMVSFDLFSPGPKHKVPVLYRKGDLPFTSEARQRLVDNGMVNLLIRVEDAKAYKKYVEDHMGEILSDESLELDERCDLLYNTSTDIMQDMFKDPLRKGGLQRCQGVVSHTVRMIMTQKNALQSLMSLTSHDYYTYTHSVNVCVYAIALAKELFEENQYDFDMLGTAFMLHDIGKVNVDSSIITKPGKLTSEEWDIMRSHPLEGYKILNKMNFMNKEISTIVLQHHERHDGNGYPYNLKDEQIHIFGKICCIADVFDALTTKRSYREPSNSFGALKIMKDEMHQNFDPEFFARFVYLFGSG
jgi:cyclic di-GMP phosphodiesterase